MELCEMRAEEAMQEDPPNLLLVAKFEGHLFAWTELLQKYLRESYQEGKTSEELTVALKGDKKKRYNAKPRGKRGDTTGESRVMGVGASQSGVGVEKSIRVATPSPSLNIETDNNELQPPEWEIDHPVGENIALSHYTAKQPHPDSG